ncbi:ABC transporter ATP-binding protein [Streptomyces sp. MspMP-M5]|uniref:ABC transporter ATP-binding protein n=1 Tax=unclassified Streptomyces TaxID=2593676 RepID=UPI001F488EA8|nr:ABC transporter ATP-binding protein [Streptomyces sp. MspMP-M5]
MHTLLTVGAVVQGRLLLAVVAVMPAVVYRCGPAVALAYCRYGLDTSEDAVALGPAASVDTAAQPEPHPAARSTDAVPRPRPGEQQSPAVVVEGLRRTYGGREVLGGVSFSIATGEFFGLLGPNGAGKTTTLEILEGLREPSAGRITVLGEKPWPRNARLLSRMGVQLQSSAFFDRLTVREQLESFAALHRAPARRVAATLDLVDLTDQEDVPESRLSGGQRQRLAVACALVHAPEILFLDEPSAALDPRARRNLWKVLQAVQARGTTIVYTTHHLDEAEILCDRIAILDQGRLRALDTPAALIQEYGGPTRVTIGHGVLSTAEAQRLPGADSVCTDATGLVFGTEKPELLLSELAVLGPLPGLQVRTPTLEDVYLRLTSTAPGVPA